ncbi:MAG: thioredoxin [Planctomycetia bacterium]|nr:thioredoxin [Planctomycetia bacterium]
MSDNKNLNTFTDANWSDEVGKSSLLTVVDVWAPWCGPCRVIGPVIEELADEYAGKVKIGKLNADENTMAHQLGVSGIPTILFLKEGKEVDRVVGAVPKQMLVDKIESHMAGLAQA